MSDICVGDLVQIVRTCCEFSAEGYIGTTFQVRSMGSGRSACGNCGWGGDDVLLAMADEDFGVSKNGAKAPIQWLRKIPPLSELDEVNHDEEITA